MKFLTLSLSTRSNSTSRQRLIWPLLKKIDGRSLSDFPGVAASPLHRPWPKHA
jgi:hypothetical protein